MLLEEKWTCISLKRSRSCEEALGPWEVQGTWRGQGTGTVGISWLWRTIFSIWGCVRTGFYPFLAQAGAAFTPVDRISLAFLLSSHFFCHANLERFPVSKAVRRPVVARRLPRALLCSFCPHCPGLCPVPLSPPVVGAAPGCPHIPVFLRCLPLGILLT